jgi:hypothetical protein
VLPEAGSGQVISLRLPAALMLQAIMLTNDRTIKITPENPVAAAGLNRRTG